ncbi:hypothetical protein [Xanthomonas oryzae]|uniref:hypothetical protein n=1 Tax=Xanthomonas oryzae TaxID=347 RepID=UPI001ED8F320|nr:hypothetical protein [Xanthomonas oryzae]
MSNIHAILVGTLVVNLPVVLLILGIPAGLLLFGHPFAALVSLAISPFIAWCWWWLFVPRWRLWAYERVASTRSLTRAAIAAGLIGPPGSFFERTEFTSLAQRDLRKELERRFP